MGDGQTPEEALANVQDAIMVWLEGAVRSAVRFPNRRARLPSGSSVAAQCASGSGCDILWRL